ncbi:hypothetical protein R1sor_022995 [Riccia sorocarpa]|uniref:Uncharacterized protein n=1 Tax=Riccia sorocarpa TaxID=122646 RepID=A0ABD3GNN1_9MARC
MARCKQTARKVPIETVTVDISETTPVNFSPSSVPLSGKVTLRRLDPSDPALSRYTWGAGSSLTTDAMAAQQWPLPCDIKMEIELHNDPTASWVVDYFKRGRNPPEIILRVKGEEVAGKETKTKELGIVCFTRPVESGLEIWLEVLKNKQIKRTILPMASWEHDDLLPKGKGGVLDISDDIGSNDKYSEALSSLRFKLLSEKKSHSSMWEFLEQCHTYSVDLSQLGKVAQALIFKKHSDKKFDFADYMQRKGLKITLPSTDKDPLESGGAGTSTSGEGSKKLKGKADVPAKKLKVVGGVPPKKPATSTVRIGPKPATGTEQAQSQATGTEHAPKLKIGPTPVGSKQKTGTPVNREHTKKKLGTLGITPEANLISGTSADTTGKKPKSVKIIPPTQPQPSVPSTLPSKVGSSSRRMSSTANASDADIARNSPQQSVQPLTVNTDGHSGDGGSVVDSAKKNLQVVEYINESGDEDDTSTKTKKRKAVAVLEKKSGFQPERHVVETDQVAADVKMLDPKSKDQFKPELRQWFPLGDKLVYASISQLTDPDATVVTSLSGSRLLLMPRTSRM